MRRERGRVFGEVADVYDDVRPGYPPELVDTVLAAVDSPVATAVEPGAGTGKATVALARPGLLITCVEPDPAMAGVLAARFADRPEVTVEVQRFEDWSPPDGGVDLLYCAQAWHWIDAPTRCRLAYRALRPGGVIALFGHAYLFADDGLRERVEAVYHRLAPELISEPALSDREPMRQWFAVELAGTDLFTGVSAHVFESLVRFPTERYLALAGTYSAQRMLDADLRERVFADVARTIDRHGGYVDVELSTVLAVAYRAA